MIKPSPNKRSVELEHSTLTIKNAKGPITLEKFTDENNKIAFLVKEGDTTIYKFQLTRIMSGSSFEFSDGGKSRDIVFKFGSPVDLIVSEGLDGKKTPLFHLHPNNFSAFDEITTRPDGVTVKKTAAGVAEFVDSGVDKEGFTKIDQLLNHSTKSPNLIYGSPDHLKQNLTHTETKIGLTEKKEPIISIKKS